MLTYSDGFKTHRYEKAVCVLKVICMEEKQTYEVFKTS